MEKQAIGGCWKWLVVAGLITMSAYGGDKPAAGTQEARKQFITLSGRDLKIENKAVKSGVTMMDEIARCASLSKTPGEFVSCLRHVTSNWKKQGMITGEERSRIIAAASRAVNVTEIATTHALSKSVVASAF